MHLDYGRDALNMSCGETISNTLISGVIGPVTSRQSIMVSSLLSIYGIPTLATMASSDDLSDKSRFEYFMRLVPPDKFQAEAILSFYTAHNWTYSALVFSEGGYGENGAKQIQNEAKKREICLAFVFKVPSEDSASDYDYIVKLLKANKNAKVITLFLDSYEHHFRFMSKMHEENLFNDFIWFGADAFAQSVNRLRDAGVFAIKYPLAAPVEFLEELKTWSPMTDPLNPWIYELWENIYQCSWVEDSSMTPCTDYLNATYTGWDPRREVLYKLFDGVDVYSKALHALIAENCPQLFIAVDKETIQDCIKGGLLLSYMKEVTFQGLSGPIEFDQFGDLVGQFYIAQLQGAGMRPEWKNVALWDKTAEPQLDIFKGELFWPGYIADTEKLNELRLKADVPISICSAPCGKREQLIQRLLPCCWECKPCRENEIVTANGTQCNKCADTYWPDDHSGTCAPIGPEYLHWTGAISISLVTVTSCGLVSGVTCIVMFWINRHNKLIMASSRELMMIVMLGIMLAYGTVFVLLAKPETISCVVSTYGFLLSVTLIYCPLLVKTNRVYR